MYSLSHSVIRSGLLPRFRSRRRNKVNDPSTQCERDEERAHGPEHEARHTQFRGHSE